MKSGGRGLFRKDGGRSRKRHMKPSLWANWPLAVCLACVRPTYEKYCAGTVSRALKKKRKNNSRDRAQPSGELPVGARAGEKSLLTGKEKSDGECRSEESLSIARGGRLPSTTGLAN